MTHPVSRRRPWLAVTMVTLLAGAAPAPGEGPAGPGVDAPAPIENLRAFARLYGLVRFFHPSDEAAATDWDAFAVHGVRQVRDAADRAELERRLEALFAPIAPTVTIYPEDEAPPDRPAELVPPDPSGLEVVAWQHLGVGFGFAGNPYRSYRLNRVTELRGGAVASFGTIAQEVDAKPYRGRKVRLTAAVRSAVEGSGNQAQLWMRIDLADGATGFFDNMSDRPVIAPEWGTYTLEGQVADDASKITVGAFLAGKGTVWLDAFELQAEQPDGEWTPVPLVNPGFEKAQGEEPVPGWGSSPQGYSFRLDAEEAFAGSHALAITDAPGAGEAVVVEEALFGARPEVGEVVDEPLGRGLSAVVPLALYSADGQTRGEVDREALEALRAKLEAVGVDGLTAEDEAVRLADVIIAWNVFQHFFPYFDVVDVDWDAALTTALAAAREDRDAAELLETLERLVAGLDDGHGRVVHPLLEGMASLPAALDWIEGKVVVVAAAEETPFERGDVLVSIDGVPAGARWAPPSGWFSSATGSRSR